MRNPVPDRGLIFCLMRLLVEFTPVSEGRTFMSRKDFHSLLRAGLSNSELVILFYLTDMCNEWGFTTQCEKTIAAFFNVDISNTYKRLAKLKKLDIIKKIEYNGRIGFMINPLYCYQGNLKLKRFRVRLWKQEAIYVKSHSKRFFGPPVYSDQEFKNRSIIQNKNGRFKHISHIQVNENLIKKEDSFMLE